MQEIKFQKNTCIAMCHKNHVFQRYNFSVILLLSSWPHFLVCLSSRSLLFSLVSSRVALAGTVFMQGPAEVGARLVSPGVFYAAHLNVTPYFMQKSGKEYFYFATFNSDKLLWMFAPKSYALNAAARYASHPHGPRGVGLSRRLLWRFVACSS